MYVHVRICTYMRDVRDDACIYIDICIYLYICTFIRICMYIYRGMRDLYIYKGYVYIFLCLYMHVCIEGEVKG